MTRLDRTNAPHHVYRCYDATGRLIYVGSSANLFGRLEAHRSTSWWAPTVANVKAIYFPNGILAREVERRAIREEVPRWNKSGKWAGRHLWTQEDWHDWITTILRGNASSGPTKWVTAELSNSVADYVALFGERLPDSISHQVEEVYRLDAERKDQRRREDLERRVAFEAREAAEQKFYDELAAKRAKKKGRSA